jgi:hypothetical protein
MNPIPAPLVFADSMPLTGSAKRLPMLLENLKRPLLSCSQMIAESKTAKILQHAKTEYHTVDCLLSSGAILRFTL